MIIIWRRTTGTRSITIGGTVARWTTGSGGSGASVSKILIFLRQSRYI